jgi:hypothetical protein
MAIFTLFGQQDAYSSFEHLILEITKEINAKPNDFVLNIDKEEWKEYFVNKYEFIPIEVFPDKATSSFKSKTKTQQEQYGRTYEGEAYNFEVKVPFTGSSFLLMLRPSTCVLNHPRVDAPQADAGFITGTITLHEQNPQQFEYEKSRLISAITANVPNINRDVSAFNARIATHFEQEYNNKRQKVLAERQFFEALNISIDTSTDKIFKVPVAEKKKIPEPIFDKKTTKKFTADNPVLPDEFYEDVIEIIYAFFKSVEKKPSIYHTKDEEALRDYVLPTLETRYNNTTVTGETFNKGGKTDILVKYKDNTNLFVAECKFWKGEAVFNDTINQLFDRYLTWRDSKVAIIFFVTNKEFSKVLATIHESVVKHPYFLRANGSHGESSFSYIFHFPTDKGKYIYTEIMAFHFP